jgi:hypothetical protein
MLTRLSLAAHEPDGVGREVSLHSGSECCGIPLLARWDRAVSRTDCSAASGGHPARGGASDLQAREEAFLDGVLDLAGSDAVANLVKLFDFALQGVIDGVHGPHAGGQDDGVGLEELARVSGAADPYATLRR